MQKKSLKIPKESHDVLVFGAAVTNLSIEAYILNLFKESKTYNKHSSNLLQARKLE